MAAVELGDLGCGCFQIGCGFGVQSDAAVGDEWWQRDDDRAERPIIRVPVPNAVILAMRWPPLFGWLHSAPHSINISSSSCADARSPRCRMRLRSGWRPIRLYLLASDDGYSPARIGQPRLVVPGCNDGLMSSTASPDAAVVRPDQRLEALFEELAELTGQRNAIDGRIVEIVAEVDRDELWGATGARSVAALVAWKTGSSSGNAKTIATVAQRLAAFPRCAQGMREGRLSLDQVGVIAGQAADGSDEHYAELARCATVNQLRTAVKLEPRPEPDPRPDPQPSITRPPTRSSAAGGSDFRTWTRRSSTRHCSLILMR